MKLWTQTTATDCVPACLASLLGVELSAIPDFMALRDGQGWGRVREWLRARGWALVDLEGPWVGRGYVLVRGMSPRRTRHCVLGLDGKIAHDPHPSRAGLVAVDRVTELVPVGPVR